ncbi:MAG TPA: FecR domain-containing protein [Terriglobia bacterium]|nr:FecR domain-containing protein [Terriglobia bacterium]
MRRRINLRVWLTLLLVPLAGLRSEAGGAKVIRAGAVGTVVGWGDLEVDNLPAPPGTALFARDVITTGARSGALLRLLAGGVVTVAGDSEVALLVQPSGGTTPALELRRGGLLVRSFTGESSEIRVPGASLTLKGSSAACRVAAVGSSSAVVAESGRVMIQGAGAPLVLVAGKAVRLEAGIPQDVSQAASATTEVAPTTVSTAGRVTQLYPEETVEHAGSRLAVPLRLNELVSQGDGIRTSAGGRVRMQLLDGSFAALGGGTSMRLIRHDPDTQQTQIELQYGRVRAEATRPAQPQSSFEVRTVTAVVKGSATTFVVDAGTKITRVCNAGAGLLSLASISPSLGGAVTLHKGDCSAVRHDGAPGAPRQAETEVRREMALTGFAGVPTIERTAKIVAVHEATTGTLVLAAILAGVSYGVVDGAVNQINDTSSNLLKAAGQFGAATTAANSATATANTAAAIGAAVCAAIEATAVFDGLPVSPSGPGSFNCPR